MKEKSELALVVGGTSGLGLAVTRCLLARSWDVVTVGRERIQATVSRHYICDLADFESWRVTLAQIKANHPKIALAGFITGFARAVDPQTVTPADRQKHYRLNSDYVADAHAVLAETLQRGAKVFTVGSQWTFRRGCRWLIPYMMAKQALSAITFEFRHLPQVPQVRHFCVPTMDTPAFAKVKESFVQLGLDREFASLAFEREITSPDEVSKVLVDHLIDNHVDGPMLKIDARLKVSAEKHFTYE